ncbi:hypothetical protein [Elioraea sp.]|uniref:hypothetical protein n=1 Tax=Elioraea sp. TaxID=2185103 RepID=UPI00307D0AF7
MVALHILLVSLGAATASAENLPAMSPLILEAIERDRAMTEAVMGHLQDKNIDLAQLPKIMAEIETLRAAMEASAPSQKLLIELVDHARARHQCEGAGMLYLPGHASRDARGCVPYSPAQQPEAIRSGSRHRR